MSWTRSQSWDTTLREGGITVQTEQVEILSRTWSQTDPGANQNPGLSLTLIKDGCYTQSHLGPKVNLDPSLTLVSG